MSTKKTPALRSAWALMLVVPLAALVPPGRPPRTTKLDVADAAFPCRRGWCFLDGGPVSPLADHLAPESGLRGVVDEVA